MFCEKCGTQLNEGDNVCSKCGMQIGGQGTQSNTTERKSKIAAGLFGIVFGWLGLHNFYLGKTRNAIIQLSLSLAGVITCGLTYVASLIWGLVEGIMIIAGKITTDANGVPLRE